MPLMYSLATDEKFRCPDFELETALHGRVSSKDLYQSKPFVIVFMCNHCPYVKAIKNRIIATYGVLKVLGVPFLAINSNDPEAYPEDSFENMKAAQYPFPYAFDSDQSVAKAFDAQCTPEFFVFNQEGYLRYRGRLDDNWQDATQVRRFDLLEAVAFLLRHPHEQLPWKPEPSMGCSIKWRKNPNISRIF